MIMIATLVDPPAKMINATGDTNAAIIAARILEGKDWYAKSIEWHLFDLDLPIFEKFINHWDLKKLSCNIFTILSQPAV